MKYEDVGVSISRTEDILKGIRQNIRNTHNRHVLKTSFASAIDISKYDYLSPVLVSTTDGIGTKTRLAIKKQKYDGLGYDLVNHCMNDLLCAGQGVKPLFFMDYIGFSNSDVISNIINSICNACHFSNVPLIGGEIAEMPGIYQDGQIDVVGTLVGLVEKENLYPLSTIQPGDLLIGLPSSGFHTNGYSFINQYETIEDNFLTPHRSYLSALINMENVQSVAHITGGGLVDNVPRMFPDGLTARINKSSWKVPRQFRKVQKDFNVTEDEMFRVFNMGIGMVVAVPRDSTDGPIIGEVIEGKEIEWIN